jgi:glutamine amidotransferase
MRDPKQIRVAIVDYGMGNLFSVQRAFAMIQQPSFITSSPAEIEASDALILPGVGAFGDAMKSLRASGLVEPLRSFAGSNRPFLGICLGMQLLMSESSEFGLHEGLDIIRGKVVRLPAQGAPIPVKVPQVGWNQIVQAKPWNGTPLEGFPNGGFVYFVHSFYVVPEDQGIVLSATRYGGLEFCSSIQAGRVFGFQFHPERSGPLGLAMLAKFQSIICRD